MKRIAILGSTGSIGTQTLDVVRANGDIEVVGPSRRAAIFRRLEEPDPGIFADRSAASGMRRRRKNLALSVSADTDTKIVSGMEGLMEIAVMEGYEILVTAVVGMIGIRPTMAAIETGKGYCPGK